jgi:hypothetical protein
VAEIDVYLITPMPELLVTGTTMNLLDAGASVVEVIETPVAIQIIAHDADPLLRAFAVILLLVLVKK